MNWHKQLRQKLVNFILDIRVKDSIAGFLDRELDEPSTIPLPDRVIHKRKKHGKPTNVKKWSELDLEGLIAVVDDPSVSVDSLVGTNSVSITAPTCAVGRCRLAAYSDACR